MNYPDKNKIINAYTSVMSRLVCQVTTPDKCTSQVLSPGKFTRNIKFDLTLALSQTTQKV
jgi:hypothetical protein